jgi:putative endonuclease
MHTTYILYSESIGRYYVGSTSVDIESRIKRHNSWHRGFTGKASDWELKYSKEFLTVSESRSMERKIKKRGAFRYLESELE